jgi:2-isopropylmalate synthase/homocitrate synthase family protein
LSRRTEQAKQIWLYDTTLRDGTQGEGISFSAEDKVNVAVRLDRFGIDYIEGGWPGSNPKDVEFFQRIKDVELIHAQIAAFGSTRRAHIAVEDDENLKALLRSGARVATIFGKSWNFHVTNALRTTLDENLRMIEESVAYLKEQGLEVIYDAEHFFDGYYADKAYALETLKAAVRGGASVVVLCDTNGGRLPHEVAEAVRHVRAEVDVPIGIHTHNDSGLAVANALAAVKEGAVHVQGTINGYGERSGNCDLIQVIPNLQLKMGLVCVPEERMRELTELSLYVSEMANMRPDPRQPFVGRSVFAHKGGAHVSAILRHPETYEHIPPESVGNQRRVLVSELSGASNVIYKARDYGIELSKDSPALRKVVNTIKELEHQGYHFEGAEASFELILKKALGLYQPYFELVGLRLTVDKRDPLDEPVAEATIKVKVGEHILHTAADGNGPVNALDSALRKALETVYPQIRRIKLVDYKVRVLNERAGTAAKVRVLIRSSDDGKSWGTVGVSTNIIEASWRALVDSIEYGLMRANAAAEPIKVSRPV